MGSGALRGWASRQAVGAAVIAGGAIGASMRFALEWLLPVEPGAWPWATFVANVVGTALLGLVATRFLERLPPSAHRRPLLGTGLCGALTTFSSLHVEAISLARDGHAVMGGAYVAASVAVGLACIALASALVRRARMGLR